MVAVVARSEAAVLWLEQRQHRPSRRLVDRLADRVEGLPTTAFSRWSRADVCEAAVGSGRRVVAASTAPACSSPSPTTPWWRPDATAFGGVVDDFLALATGDRESATRARISYEQLGAWWWARRRALDLHPSTSLPRVLHLHPSHRASTGDRSGASAPDGHTHLVTAMPGLEHLRALLHTTRVAT